MRMRLGSRPGDRDQTFYPKAGLCHHWHGIWVTDISSASYSYSALGSLPDGFYSQLDHKENGFGGWCLYTGELVKLDPNTLEPSLPAQALHAPDFACRLTTIADLEPSSCSSHNAPVKS